MIVINTVDEKYFELNGIQYIKIYQPLAQGSAAIGIYSIYDTKLQLINSTVFSDYQIDGSTYATQALTIAALLDVIYNPNYIPIAAGVGVELGGVTNLAQSFEGEKTFVDNLLVSKIGGGNVRAAATQDTEEYYAELYGRYVGADIGGVRTYRGNLIRYSDAGIRGTFVGVNDVLYLADIGKVGVETASPDAQVTVSGEGNVRAEGGIVINNQTGTSYIFVLGDAGTVITANNIALQTFDLPANASVSYTVGAVIKLENIGTGTVQFRDKDAIVLATLAQGEAAYARNIGADNWFVLKY